MENSEVSLLALIHQHLVLSGYSKAARALQHQSGKKFTSQNVLLHDIFTYWTKHQNNDKKTVNHDINKQRVPDPMSSSETSDEEDREPALGAKTVIEKGKKITKKQDTKAKVSNAKTKNVNSVKTSASKAKILPEIPSKLATVSESSESSDSEEETASKVAPPAVSSAATTKPPLKTAESSDISSSSDSEMETAKQPQVTAAQVHTLQKTGTTATPSKTKKHSTTAPAKPDTDEGSGSSDTSDSDDDVVPATQTLIPAPHGKTSLATKLSGTPQLAKTVKPVTPAKAPALAVAKSSDSSSSSDSDEEPAAKTPLPASQGKNKLPIKSSGAPTPLLAKSVKAASPAKSPVTPAAESSESSDSSDSEEEPNIKTPPPSSQGKTKPAAKSSGAPTPLLAKSVKATSPAKTPVASVQKPVAESSESSGSSDSDEEPNVKTPLPAFQGKTKPAAKSSGAPIPLLAKSVKAASQAKTSVASVQKSAAESSGSSDSDEEPNAKIPPPSSQGKSKLPIKSSGASTPLLAKSVKAASPAKTLVASVQKPAADSSESSGSSDSDEEPNAKNPLPAPQGKTKSTAKSSGASIPLLAKSVKAASPAKATVQKPAAESSESGDSSDSEDDTESKKKPVLPTPIATKTAQKNLATPVMKPLLTSTPADVSASKGKGISTLTPITVKPKATDNSVSSDTTDSDDETFTLQTPPTVKAKPGNVTPAATNVTAAKGKASAQTPATLKPTAAAESSDSSDSSDSDEELSVKKAPIVTPNKASLAKSTTNATKVVKGKDTARPSDSGSSDSDEGMEAKTGPPTSALSNGKKGISVASQQAQHTGPKAALTSAKTDSADVSETSDSSESEDETVTQVCSSASVKVKSSKASGDKKSIDGKAPGGSASSAPPALPIPTKTNSSSEDSSDAELENSEPLHKLPVSAKPAPQKRKRPLKTNNKLPSAMDETGKKKNESSNKIQPGPASAIDSEVETVMALLAGESPKKNKTKSKRKALENSAAAVAVSTELRNNVNADWVPESPSSVDGKAQISLPTVATIGALTASVKEKKAKKRKISSEDAAAKKMAKLAKKAKKEGKKEKKKLKLAAAEAGDATPKKKVKKDKLTSEKKKSNKKKKASKEKKKKGSGDTSLGKKVEASDIPSKPKKKKKTSTEKAD